MRAILKFQSAQEFQIFFSQLISCEIPDFMPVDGSSGDSGFDGIDNETAYQVYFPEQHNRTNKKYIAKIDKDLKKVLKNKLGLKIKKWVFVVPEDLRMPVIAHLIKKSKEAGVKLTYIGANTLTQLASKYPHIIDSFPLIFMPSVKEDIKEVKSLVKQKGKMVSLDGVEVIGDEEFSRAIEQIRKKYQPGIDMIPKRPDGSLYRPNARDLEHIAEMQSLQEELGSKKRRSDQAFELDVCFSEQKLRRNILGRDVLDKLQVGFREHYSRFYVSTEP